MKDYSAIEQKLNALMEELKILKEADDVEVEETEKEEETAIEETPIEEVPAEEIEEVSEEEVEEIKDEEPVEANENPFLVDTFAKSILSGLMQNVDDINVVLDNAEDSKYNGIFADVKELLNKAIGSLQAVLADDSEDAEQQDEAREEAEEKIEDAEADVEETEEVKVEDEEKVELIQPIGGESDDISAEEVEETETEEKTEESLKEELEIVIGLDKFTPWSGAVDTFDYILSEYGYDYDAMERVLEDIFPDGCTDVELNDLFRFDEEIYNLFGVKDPYAEDDEDEEEEEEVEEDDDIEIEESASRKVRHR